jgi:hypothetical protein
MRAEYIAAASEGYAGVSTMSIRAEMAWLGFQEATKRGLQAVILNAMKRDMAA